jgi:hypothetical protein
MVHIWNKQLGINYNFIFDRHQLIALSNDDELRYVNVGYQEKTTTTNQYASGRLQAIGSPILPLENIHFSNCNRFSSNGNSSFICTSEPLVTDNNTVIWITLINVDIQNQLISNITFNQTLPKIEAEFCQVAAVDSKSHQLLAYCCKLLTGIICQSNGNRTNFNSSDDFILDYDFDAKKFTLIQSVDVSHNPFIHRLDIHIFVEGESIQPELISFSRSVIGASINEYNSILFAVTEGRDVTFYDCFVDDNNVTCQNYSLKFDQKFDQLTDILDRPFYSVDFVGNNSKTEDGGFNLIGLHSQPISYLSVETGSDTLMIKIDNNCTKSIVRFNTVTLFCCFTSTDSCGLMQFALSYNRSTLINGSIADDQDECTNGQGDGGGGECHTGTLRPRSTTPPMFKTTKNDNGRLSTLLLVAIVLVALLIVVTVTSTVIIRYRRRAGRIQPTGHIPLIDMERIISRTSSHGEDNVGATTGRRENEGGGAGSASAGHDHIDDIAL